MQLSQLTGTIIVLISFVLFACNPPEKPKSKGDEPAFKKPPIAVQKYKQLCSPCHGITGNLQIGGAKDLTQSNMSKPDIIHIIANGSENKKMAGYKGMLSSEEIDKMADYIIQFRK